MTDQPNNAKRVHDEAIFIDAVSPLANSNPELLNWWIEGGTTAVAPTVGGSDASGPTVANLGRWNRIIENDPRLRLITKGSDFESVKREGKLGILYHFQGTTPLEDNLDLLSVYKRLGVGMIQLAYNVKNPIGDGCEERTDSGLSYFGVAAIQRMNEERIIVDCSHTGYQTTMEAIELSSAPVVFSHANSKVIKPSPRTIVDDQIKAVAATGGLVGIVGFPAFVADAKIPSLDDFIDHIEHVVNLVGINHVGLGIDYFHGQVDVASEDEANKSYDALIKSGAWRPEAYPPPPYHYPEGIETPRTFPNLTARLLERGHSEDDVKKIVGGNWVRVFKDVWDV